MVFVKAPEQFEITESIEKDILECALVFQDWRKRLLYIKSDNDTVSQLIDPTWDALPFKQYQYLAKYNICAGEWNINSIIALKDTQDWSLIYVATDYSNLYTTIETFMNDRTNHDMFCSARNSIIDFICMRFCGKRYNQLQIKKEQASCLLYILVCLLDQRASEIESVYILHALIIDFVFSKIFPNAKNSWNNNLRQQQASLELSYCIKLSLNDNCYSGFPIYLPAYNVIEPFPFKNTAYLKHLVFKFICGFEMVETTPTVRKEPLDLLGVHDTIIKTSFKYCTNHSHKVVDLLARVPVIRSNGEVGTDIIPAAYCFGCNEYYILIEDYKQLCGIPLCRVYSTTSIERAYFSTQSFLSYQYQSIVFAYGYNVNANNNISVHQRRAILKEIINRKILSRVEVISHLKFLIAINKNKSQFSSAIKKWENDKQYIEDHITEEPSFTVNDIYIQ